MNWASHSAPLFHAGNNVALSEPAFGGVLEGFRAAKCASHGKSLSFHFGSAAITNRQGRGGFPLGSSRPLQYRGMAAQFDGFARFEPSKCCGGTLATIAFGDNAH